VQKWWLNDPLHLKSITVPFPDFKHNQLLCIIVSGAQNGEFERFGGFGVDCYYTLYHP